MPNDSGTDSDPDLKLISALQRGDDSALDGLMARYKEPIFRFIQRHVPNHADALELTQDVFLRVYTKCGQFRAGSKFSTWLFAIALNLCRDHAKTQRYKQAIVTDSLSRKGVDGEEETDRDLPGTGGTPADDLQMTEKMAWVQRGIARLPFDLRTALILNVVEQRSQAEVASLLKTTAKTVETRVYRARHMLSDFLRKAGF
jgi:RNA polymerase sigma factor (sigma-70 family)